jgi:metal-dependent amidase/aminoacylase/carboxypeptidase family protein
LQHNLIAIVGLGTFLTLRKLLIKEKINGTVILLGTPAEEGGGGKIKLLEQGAYDGMDACLSEYPLAGDLAFNLLPATNCDGPLFQSLVSHPSTASAGGKYGHVGPSLASAFLDVEYTGRT